MGLDETIGQNVRIYRRKSRLTQEQLASRLGVSRSTIIRLERGRTSWPISELERIAYVLDTTVDKLMK